MKSDYEIERDKHILYMLKKRNDTVNNWENIMFKGGLFSDFKKPVTVKTNVSVSQESKKTKDKPTEADEVEFSELFKYLEEQKDRFRFPKGRMGEVSNQ